MALFDKNCSHFFLYPFRLSFVEVPTIPDASEIQAPIQLLIAVPKRNFKRAVHRNRMKRRIRELFRLHKHSIEQSLSNSPKHWAILVHVVSKKECSYQEMQTPFIQLMNRLQQHVS